MKPSIFVGSASENLQIVARVSDLLAPVATVTPWTNGVFRLGDTSIESLHTELDKHDFALFVVCKNDVVVSRGQRSEAPRDNVIFEMGLFSGRLGRHRTIFLRETGILKWPSDLLGVTTAQFDPAKRASLPGACTTIKKHIENTGPRGQMFCGPTYGLVSISPGTGRQEAFEGVRVRAGRKVVIVGAALANLATWQVKSLQETAERVPIEVLMTDPEALERNSDRANLFDQFFNIPGFSRRVRESYDAVSTLFAEWNLSGAQQPVSLYAYSSMPTMSMVMRDPPNTQFPNDGEAMVEFFLFQCGSDRPRMHLINDGDRGHLFLRVLREYEGLKSHARKVV